MKRDTKEKELIKKPFLTTAIVLIVMGISFFVSFTLGHINYIYFITSILIFLGMFLLYAGFYILGKKYVNRWLMNLAILGVVLSLGFLVLFHLSYSPNGLVEFNETHIEVLLMRQAEFDRLILENASEEVISSFVQETIDQGIVNYPVKFLFSLLIFFLVGYFVFAIYITFFGIAMIKLKKVEYAKVIGILDIVSVWLIPTFIGIFLAIPIVVVSYILTILMFFNESKKAKE